MSKIKDLDGNEFDTFDEAREYYQEQVHLIVDNLKLINSLEKQRKTEERLDNFKEVSRESLNDQYDRASQQVKVEFSDDAGKFFKEGASNVNRVKNFVDKLNGDYDPDPLATVLGSGDYTVDEKNKSLQIENFSSSSGLNGDFRGDDMGRSGQDFTVNEEILTNVVPDASVSNKRYDDKRPDYSSNLLTKEKRDKLLSNGEITRGQKGLSIAGDSVVGTQTWAEIVREKNPDLKPHEPEYVRLEENGASNKEIRKAKLRHQWDIRRKSLEVDPKIALYDMKNDTMYHLNIYTKEARDRVKYIDKKYHVRNLSLLGLASGFGILLYRELSR